VEAFNLASDPGFVDPGGLLPCHPQRLYFHTIPRAFLKSAVLLLRLSGRDPRKFGSNGDIDLVSIANENFPVHASINYQPVREIRDRAAACHISQGGAKVATGIQAWLRNIFQMNELFMQAYPDPRKNTHLRDLFDGVELQT
jgi:hypothetical protein